MHAAAGTSIVGGIAIGRIRMVRPPEYQIDASPAENPQEELRRYEAARLAVRRERRAMSDMAASSGDTAGAAILGAHADLLDDDGLRSSVRTLIMEEGHRAPYAVQTAHDRIARRFAAMNDETFRTLASDLDDLRDAILSSMQGKGTGHAAAGNGGAADTADAADTTPAILAADDLAPSELIRYDRAQLLGIVLRQGSAASHTVILARAMHLPVLIQCAAMSADWDGRPAVLDGDNARVYVDPTPELLAEVEARQREDAARRAALEALKGVPNVTQDGTRIRLYANMSGLQDIEAVLESDAGGVGLLRSEFLYLGSDHAPSEEEQYLAYRQVLAALAPRPVIIRTADIGADKELPYLDLGREENPALGFRAIRIGLSRTDFFKTQLRALLRASAYGNLGILFPMITSVAEIRACKDILTVCRKDLLDEGYVLSANYKIGIMVETPAAALCADALLSEVQFCSIGTNDLTQYTCAIDRGSARLAPFLNEHHPAVMRQIAMTAEAAHRHQVPVAICGELAADPSLTATFLRMGIDELSVNPADILPLRAHIRSLDLA